LRAISPFLIQIITIIRLRSEYFLGIQIKKRDVRTISHQEMQTRYDMPHSVSKRGFAIHNPIADLFRYVALGFSAAEQRRQLAALDDKMLRDIGLTREAANAEARRPGWDVPHSWLR